MKRFFAILFVFAVAEIQAATVLTVNWAASTNVGFGLQDGTPLAVGNEIRLGAFDFADNILNSEVQARLNSGNLVDLLSHFILFDTARIGDALPASGLAGLPSSSRSGLFEKSSNLTLATGSPLFGKQMFMWVFKTTANNTVASNFSNVTQTGIFSNNTTAWFFPSDSGNPESRPIELANLTNSGSTVASSARPIVATGSNSFGTATSTLATGSNKVFELAPVTVTSVPEPTSASLLLALLGGACCLRPNRRRV